MEPAMDRRSVRLPVRAVDRVLGGSRQHVPADGAGVVPLAAVRHRRSAGSTQAPGREVQPLEAVGERGRRFSVGLRQLKRCAQFRIGRVPRRLTQASRRTGGGLQGQHRYGDERHHALHKRTWIHPYSLRLWLPPVRTVRLAGTTWGALSFRAWLEPFKFRSENGTAPARGRLRAGSMEPLIRYSRRRVTSRASPSFRSDQCLRTTEQMRWRVGSGSPISGERRRQYTSSASRR